MESSTVLPTHVAMQRYVRLMLGQVPGVKVLVLDPATTGMISVVFSQTDILSNEVFLVKEIQTNTQNKAKPSTASHEDPTTRESMKHLNAVYFLRPTAENILALVYELKHPTYAGYYLFFTSYVEERQLERLAKSDQLQRVHHVTSLFCDFMALGPGMFSLELLTCHPLMFPESLQYSAYEVALLERVVSGIASSLLSSCSASLSGIRFPVGSEVCRCIAEQLQHCLSQWSPLVDSPVITQTPDPGGATSMILLFDRRDDPVTPLLNQWTYQAMTHELLGIDRNTVTLKDTSAESGNTVTSLVLNPYTDSFFNKHRVATFGDLGVAVRAYLKSFQDTVKTTGHHRQDMSLSEMKTFVENYPEFRRLSTNVAQHVQLVHELSRLVETRHLFTVSALEQELTCMAKKHEHFNEILGLIQRQNVPKYELLRLGLLFALRYEGDPLVQRLQAALAPTGVDTSLFDSMLVYAGKHARSLKGDLFEQNKSIFELAKSAVQRGFQQEMSNVYTQHQSRLGGVVENLLKGKLREAQDFGQLPFRQGVSLMNVKPTELIVFVIGGATYEEAADLSKIAQVAQKPIYLGGTTFHNSRSFLAEVALTKRRPTQQLPAPVVEPPQTEELPFSAPQHHRTLPDDETNTAFATRHVDSREADLELKKKFLLEGW